MADDVDAEIQSQDGGDPLFDTSGASPGITEATTTTSGGNDSEVVTHGGDGVINTATGAENTQTDGTTGTGDAPVQDLFFPLDLEIAGQWITFRSFQYSRSNRLQNTPIKTAYTGSVALPVPASLTTKYGMKYDNSGLGIDDFAGIAAIKAGQIVRSSIRNSAGGREAARSIADEVAHRKGKVGKEIFGIASGFALDKFTPEGVELELGVTHNPHMAVLFKGVEFRTHSFAYKFVPRNEAETQMLTDIIMVFKSAMAPTFTEGFKHHLFNYPDEWDINFFSDAHLFTIGESVLTDFSVNYHGENISSYHTIGEDKAPTSIELSFSFTETHINTREDIQTKRR